MQARWCSLLHDTHRCRPAWLHGRSTVTVLKFFFLVFFKIFYCFVFFLFTFFHLFSSPIPFAFCFWGQSLWTFFFSTFPSFQLFLLHSSCEGCRVFPAQLLHSHTHRDTLMTTALCASPAARMRRDRDERRAEGAVTCGRATRACGAEHTFLSLLFCFLWGQGGQTPAALHTHSHTLPPCFFFFLLFVRISRAGSPVSISLPPDDFFLLLRSLSRWSDATAVMSACFSQSSHTHERLSSAGRTHAPMKGLRGAATRR
ncbi:hypothetical protein ECC02_011349 [Trypanosoma cruzi]|uniref:ATPase n=1 Tax=Trypanosoma cruzi TaxID=5693 RepID=A0A7J6XPN0_TRYCR|nr:hypothetical protein ECC02_011349 [Trypanosoma cruzi]